MGSSRQQAGQTAGHPPVPPAEQPHRGRHDEEAHDRRVEGRDAEPGSELLQRRRPCDDEGEEDRDHDERGTRDDAGREREPLGDRALVLAVTFGLSMDYEVFLLTRIRERWLDHGDNERAVAEGLAQSARIITSAALVMVAVFFAFVVAGAPSLKDSARASASRSSSTRRSCAS